MAKTQKNPRFTFKNGRGVKYEVLFRKPNSKYYGNADGICASPSEDHPRIHINPNLTSQSELNTAIHEMAHAFFWDKPETEILKYANAVSRFLYTECGWRKAGGGWKNKKK